MKNCPKCSIPLTPAEYEGFDVLRCDQCRGHLVNLPRLESIKRIALKTREELKAEAEADFQGTTAARIQCPRCRLLMRKQPLKLPIMILDMDLCEACQIAWFDGGELALVQLGHEASARFANAQDIRKRMDALEASPERKASFEEDLANLPDNASPFDEALDEIASEALWAILKARVRR